MALGMIALTAMQAAQKGLQTLRRMKSDNKQLEKETSSAGMHTDSQHMWLQPELATFSFPVLYSCTAILLSFLALPTFIVPECLSALDIQQGYEGLHFALLWKQHSSQKISNLFCLWYLQLSVVPSQRPLLAQRVVAEVAVFSLWLSSGFVQCFSHVKCICSHQNRKQTLPLLTCYYMRAPVLKTHVSLTAVEGCTWCKLQSLGEDYPRRCMLWVQSPPPGQGGEHHWTHTPSAAASCGHTMTNVRGCLRCLFLNHW